MGLLSFGRTRGLAPQGRRPQFAPTGTHLDVPRHHAVVNQRGEAVHQQDAEHHALRVGGIEDTQQDGEGADEQAVDPFADVGLCRGDRVGGHEYRAEGKAAHEVVVVEGQLHVGVGADGVEKQTHQTAAQHHAQHDAPRGDAGEEEQDGAKGDGDDARLAGAAGDGAYQHVEGRGLERLPGGQLSHGRGTREGIRAPKVGGNPDAVAAHVGGVAEEEEGARHEGGVEEVHACAAEDLLAYHHGEGHGQGELPEGCGDGDDHRDDEARDEESLVDFVMAYLGEHELDGQADDIAHRNQGQHAQEAEPETI